jgi:hypothetical protein
LGDEALRTKTAVSQRFERDPFAFVLYGRGVATYLGLASRHRSQDEAIKVLTRSLVIDPKVPETRRFLGVIHLDNGRPGHARACGRSLWRLGPTIYRYWPGWRRWIATDGLPPPHAAALCLYQIDGVGPSSWSR